MLSSLGKIRLTFGLKGGLYYPKRLKVTHPAPKDYKHKDPVASIFLQPRARKQAELPSESIKFAGETFFFFFWGGGGGGGRVCVGFRV